jgi:hypothetical protein
MNTNQFAFPGLGTTNNGIPTGFNSGYDSTSFAPSPATGDLGYDPVPAGGTSSWLGDTGGAGAGAGAGGGGLFGISNDSLKLGLGGLQTIGNIYAAFKSAALARAQFNFSKSLATENYGNQIKTYNDKIKDVGANRAFVEGRPAGYANSFYADRALTAKKLG